MILSNTKFSNGVYARLGEDPGQADDKGQTLELVRHIRRSLSPDKPDQPLYDLTIAVGGYDLTYCGISRDGLKRLSVELGRLAEEGWGGASRSRE
jgi:hypothetical protein